MMNIFNDDIGKISLSCENQEWDLEDMEIKYLFPYLLRFEHKNQVKILTGEIFILNDNILDNFKYLLQVALQELLDDCYQIPSNKVRQKHPTWFERFTFMNKKYSVNYTTSTLGRLMYTLYLRVAFIDRATQLNKDVLLRIKRKN